MSISSNNCQFCNRKKQTSKHWDETKCVCCDVHEGQCKHRVKKSERAVLQDQDFKKLLLAGPIVFPIDESINMQQLADNFHAKLVEKEQEWIKRRHQFKEQILEYYIVKNFEIDTQDHVAQFYGYKDFYQVMSANANHKICKQCGHDNKCVGSCLIPVSFHSFSILYGLESDMCIKCKSEMP